MSGVVIQGAPQLQARFRAMADAPRDMLKDVGLRTVRESKILVHRRTGNLRRTIRVARLTDAYVDIAAGGRNNVGYAAAVEFGSRPHIIVPRRAKVLAWGGSRTLGGRLRKGARAQFFARRVRHPGSRPYPYLVPGLRKALDVIGLGRIVDAWNRAG